MRKLVFIGNCQVQSIFHAYKRFASKSLVEQLHYVKSYEKIEGRDRSAIEQADVILEQVQDFQPAADVAGIATRATKIGVPVVHCGFLWPFAGQPHPMNPKLPFIEGGPYGSEMSDAFLNRLIKKGTEPDEAEKAYVSLDINKTVNLERLYEVVLEKQQLRDGLTGFKISPLIEQFCRSEQIFLTPYHPNRRIAMALIEQTFQRLDVSDEDIANIRNATRVTTFPKEELPVHPAVARHFGLAWATEDRRYRFLSEGDYTFREFVRRYMTCQWNAPLEESLHLLKQNEWQKARTGLVEALKQSPRSSNGFGALATVHAKLGEHSEALAAIRSAIALDPDSGAHHLQLAILLDREGDSFAAEREYRVAAALEPFDPHYPGMLANFLVKKQRFAEAKAVAEHGVVCSPRTANLYSTIAHTEYRLGNTETAKAMYRHAITLSQKRGEALLALADIYQKDGQFDAAIPLLRTAVERDPENHRARALLARLMEQTGSSDEAAALWNDLATRNPSDRHGHDQLIHALLQGKKNHLAAQAARRALEIFPGDAELTSELSTALEALGQVDEAIALLDQSGAAESPNAKICIRRADLLNRKGNLDEAESAYRRALAVAPNSGHVLSQLGHILDRQKRHEEAIATLEAACASEPDNPHRRAQLARALVAAERHNDAEAAIRSAIADSPAVASFHLDLGHVLDHAGRTEEAIESLLRAMELNPDVNRGHGILARLYYKLQMWEKAESEYRKEIARSPGEVHWRVQLVRCLLNRNRYGEARSIARSALVLEPTNALLQSYSTTVDREETIDG